MIKSIIYNICSIPYLIYLIIRYGMAGTEKKITILRKQVEKKNEKLRMRRYIQEKCFEYIKDILILLEEVPNELQMEVAIKLGEITEQNKDVLVELN